MPGGRVRVIPCHHGGALGAWSLPAHLAGMARAAFDTCVTACVSVTCCFANRNKYLLSINLQRGTQTLSA